MRMDRIWTPKVNGDIKNVTSADSRKALIDNEGFNKSNLVQYFKYFREKNLLIKNADGGEEINPYLMTEPVDGIVEFNIILDCYGEEKINRNED